MLDDALPRVLDTTSEIHSGWQQGDFRNWSTAATVWLVAGDGLVKVVPTLRPESGDYRVVDVAISILSLAEAPPPIVRFTYRNRVDRLPVALYGAHVRLVVESEIVEASCEGGDDDGENVLAAMHFIRHLCDAVQRARGVAQA